MAGNARFVGTFTPEAGSISDNHIASAASVSVDKLQHAYSKGTNFAQAIGATPATREEILFVALNSGVLRFFGALLYDTGTSTSVTFDLKKNGTTVLTGVVTITHGTADHTIVEGTFASTSFVAGDVFSVAMTVSSSTGAQGPFAGVGYSETSAP